jgi:hypothetical protein
MSLKELYKEERRSIAEETIRELKRQLRSAPASQRSELDFGIATLQAAVIVTETSVDLARECALSQAVVSQLISNSSTNMQAVQQVPLASFPPLWIVLPTSLVQPIWPFSVKVVHLSTPHQQVYQMAFQRTNEQRIQQVIEYLPTMQELQGVWTAECINEHGQPVFYLSSRRGKGWTVSPDHTCPWQRCIFDSQGDLIDLCKQCAGTVQFLHRFLSHLSHLDQLK